MTRILTFKNNMFPVKLNLWKENILQKGLVIPFCLEDQSTF